MNDILRTLPPELFKAYCDNPELLDGTIRKYCQIPEDKYYTVSIWPIEGQVRLNNQNRKSHGKK